MVAIMWLTGGKKPPTPAKAASSGAPVQVPLEVNETKINELQNRIEELQRQQLVAQSALAQQTRLLGAAPQDSQQSQQQSASGNPPDQRAEDPIEAERKRRAYVSLFSSNVALTYRKAPPAAVAPESETTPATQNLVPVGPDSPQVAQLLKEMQANPASPTPGTPSPAPVRNDSAEANPERKKDKRPAAVSGGTETRRRAKTTYSSKEPFLKPFSSTASTGALQPPSSVSTDVYSNDRQHLLIPAGSKLLGETKKVDTLNAARARWEKTEENQRNGHADRMRPALHPHCDPHQNIDLGQPAQRALQRVQKPRRQSRSNALAKSTRLDPDKLPPKFDLTVDRKPQTLISFHHDNGAIELRRY